VERTRFVDWTNNDHQWARGHRGPDSKPGPPAHAAPSSIPSNDAFDEECRSNTRNPLWLTGAGGVKPSNNINRSTYGTRPELPRALATHASASQRFNFDAEGRGFGEHTERVERKQRTFQEKGNNQQRKRYRKTESNARDVGVLFGGTTTKEYVQDRNLVVVGIQGLVGDGFCVAQVFALVHAQTAGTTTETVALGTEFATVTLLAEQFTTVF